MCDIKPDEKQIINYRSNARELNQKINQLTLTQDSQIKHNFVPKLLRTRTAEATNSLRRIVPCSDTMLESEMQNRETQSDG
jgi:hypothetical protein